MAAKEVADEAMVSDGDTGSVKGEPSLKEGVDGKTVQISDVAENTIVTDDQLVEHEETDIRYKCKDQIDASSTEKVLEFKEIMNRWIPIDKHRLGGEKRGAIVVQYDIPRSIVSNDSCSPNVLPFEQFVYGKFDIVLRFIVASTRNVCGRYVASVLVDPSGLWDNVKSYYSLESAITRNMIYIDVNGTGTFEMNLNWVFHRSFIRLNSDYKGIEPLVYMRVSVFCLSPVRGLDGNTSKASMTVLAKIVDSSFAGMTFSKAKKQMLGVSRKIRNVVNIATHAFEDVVEELNQDKPSMYYNQNIVIPSPRAFMSQSRALSDAVPMRVDPSRLTVFNPSHLSLITISDVRHIARKWGLLTSIDWSVDDEEGKQLLMMSVDPTDLMWVGAANEDRHLTPLETICAMYQFYTGCIELRFDTVTTIFHSGALSVTVEFGRPSDTGDSCQSYATYSKIFEVGDQKTFTSIIPFIYDTVMRRLRNIPVCGAEYTQLHKVRSGLVHAVKGVVKLRVVNRLVANNVTPKVNILVFARAGANFNLKCPVQNNALMPVRYSGSAVLSDWPPTATGSEADHIVGETYDVGKGSVYVKVDSPFAKDLAMSMKEKEATLKRYKTITKKLGLSIEYEDPIDEVKHKIRHRAQLQIGDGDSTATHNVPRIPSLQTREIHTNISDILKKPLLIMEDALVKAQIVTSEWSKGSNVFAIPCMPPQTGMFNPTTMGLYAGGAIQSPQVLLTSMFRFWRGSMRFVLAFKPLVENAVMSSTIRVGFVPSSGIRRIGNHIDFYSEDNDVADETDLPFAGFSMANAGIPFELVVPSINPTYSVEVPFYTEASWAMMHQGVEPGGMNQTMPFRDRGDELVGHLLVEARVDTAMDVYWMAGDDFQVAGFVGTPGSRRGNIKYRNDNYGVQSVPRADLQGDVENILSAGKEMCAGLARPFILAAIGYAFPSLAVPMMAFVYSRKVDEIFDGVVNTTNSITDMKGQIEHTVVQSVESVVKDVRECKNEAVDTMRTFQNTSQSLENLAGVAQANIVALGGSVNAVLETCTAALRQILHGTAGIDVPTVMLNMGLDLQEVLTNFSWSGLCRMLVRFLINVKVIGCGMLTTVYNALVSISEIGSGPNLQADGDERSIEVLGSLLIAGIGTALGCTVKGGFSFVNFFTSFLSASNLALTHRVSLFIGDLARAIRAAYCWCIGSLSPEASALQELSSKREFIALFVADAEKFMHETDVRFLKTHQGKLRYWLTLCNAMQIQSMVANCPQDKTTSALFALCAQVIRKGTTLSHLITASPVRFEPFVIMIEGQPGIGKSHLVLDLVVDTLNSVGIKSPTTDILFVRNPGTEFWNGFNEDHLAVHYDDFLNMTDEQSVRTQAAEMYQLKSPAVFNPNMARLDDKEMRANPLIVVCTTNCAFPEVPAVRDVVAFNRRFDIVVHAELEQPLHGRRSVRDLPREEVTGFRHLRFRKYDEDPQRQPPTLGSTRVTYDQFKDYVKGKFSRYYATEKRNILERLERLNTLLPENAQKYAAVGDPFSLFYRTMYDVYDNDVEARPSELISEDLKTLDERLDEMPTLAQQIEAIVVPDDVVFEQAYTDYSSVMTRVYNKTTKVLGDLSNTSRKLIRSIVGISIGSKGTCCICGGEDVTVCMVCTNSTSGSSHQVCLNCTVMMRNNRSHMNCPLCRGSVVMRNMEWYEKLINVIKLAGVSGMRVLTKVYRLVVKYQLHWLSGVMHVVLYAASLFVPIPSSVSKYLFYNSMLKTMSILFPDVFENVVNSPVEAAATINGVCQFDPGYVPTVTEAVTKLVPELDQFSELFDDMLQVPGPLGPDDVVYIERVVNQIHKIAGIRDITRANDPFEVRLSSMLCAYAYYRQFCGAVVRYLDMVADKEREDLFGEVYELYSSVWALVPVVGKMVYDMDLLYETELLFEVTEGSGIADHVKFNDEFYMDFMPGGELHRRFRRFVGEEEWLILAGVMEQCPGCDIDGYEIVYDGVDKVPCNHAGLEISSAVLLPRGEQVIDVRGQRSTTLPCDDECCPFGTEASYRQTLTQIFQANLVAIRNSSCDNGQRRVSCIPPTMKRKQEISAGLISEIRAYAYDWWKYLDEKVRAVVEMAHRNMYVVAGVTSVIGGVVVAYLYLSGKCTVEQAAAYSGEVTRKLARARVVRRAGTIVQAASQGVQETESVLEHYVNNMGMFVVYENNIPIMYCGFVGLFQRVAIIPTHLVIKMRNMAGVRVTIRLTKAPQVSVDVDIHDMVFHDFEASDVSRFEVPSALPMFVNLLRFMPTVQEVSDEGLASEGLMIEQPRVSGDTYAIVTREVVLQDIEPDLEVSGAGGRKMVHDVVVYNYSQPGACGSFVLSVRSRHPLVGMHIAGEGLGHAGTGYAVLLTRDMFEGDLVKIHGVARRPEVVPTQDPVTTLEEVGLIEHGHVDKSLSVYVPTMSSIVPSIYAKDLPEAKTEPVILSPKDPRFEGGWESPMMAGVKKQGKIVGMLKSKPMDKVSKFMDDFICGFGQEFSGARYRKPLSMVDVVCGVPGVKGYDSLDLSTSPGWPWNAKRCPKNKLLTVDHDRRVVEIDPALTKILNEESELRRSGYIVPTLFTDTLKDERRKKEKVRKEGGTRLINGSPLQYTLAVRKLWLHFSAAMAHNRLENMIGIGINPDGPEWATLHRKLREKNRLRVVALDYKDFGPAFSSQAFEVAIGSMVKWLSMHTSYTDAELLEAELLIREAQNSMHIKNNIVYQQFSGAPSGNPMTSLINSLVNLVYVLYAWCVVTDLPPSDFQKHAYCCVYGDDLIMAVKPEFLGIFNGRLMAEALAKSNIVVTSAIKGDRVEESIDYDQATFLRRGFKAHPRRKGMYLAPLEWDSVEECVKFVHKSDDVRKASHVNLVTSLRLSYTHGEEVFNEWKKKLTKLCIKYKQKPPTFSWEDVDDDCFEKGKSVYDMFDE